jgi:hypothetical protein
MTFAPVIVCGNRAHSALTAHGHDDGPEGVAAAGADVALGFRDYGPT